MLTKPSPSRMRPRCSRSQPFMIQALAKERARMNTVTTAKKRRAAMPSTAISALPTARLSPPRGIMRPTLSVSACFSASASPSKLFPEPLQASIADSAKPPIMSGRGQRCTAAHPRESMPSSRKAQDRSLGNPDETPSIAASSSGAEKGELSSPSLTVASTPRASTLSPVSSPTIRMAARMIPMTAAAIPKYTSRADSTRMSCAEPVRLPQRRAVDARLLAC